MLRNSANSARSTQHSALSTRDSSKYLWDDLPRFFAQEVHHLSFAVETHHPAGDGSRMFRGCGADDLLHFRDVRSVHTEDVQAQPQQQKSVQWFASHFTTDAYTRAVSSPGADDVSDELKDRRVCG